MSQISRGVPLAPRSVVMRPSNAVIEPLASMPSPRATVAAGSRHYVDLGTFASRDLAADRLRSVNPALHSSLEPVLFGGRLAWRSRLGPFEDHSSAGGALTAALEAGALGARIASE